MAQERAHVATNRAHGSVPEESSFVVAARATIPAARVRATTATTRGRGGASTARGRGRTSTTGQARGRGRKRSYNSANVPASPSLPDLNATAAEEEIQITQNAPTN
jgi:hypothetical protein